MIRILSISLLVLFFSACSDKPELPGNVLPADKMNAVLWDAMRIDELVVSNYQERKDSTFDTEAYRTGLYEAIFRVHGITRVQFKTSLQFYQSRPDLLKVVLDSLQNRAAKQPVTRTQDSLK